MTRTRPTKTPYSLQSLQTGFWENWQKPTKGENSYQGQLSHTSGMPGWERKVKFHTVPSFENSYWQGKKRVRIRFLNCDLWICFEVSTGYDPFSPRDSYCLLVSLALCSENLASRPLGWRTPPKIWLQKCGLHSIFRVPPTVAGSQGDGLNLSSRCLQNWFWILRG